MPKIIEDARGKILAAVREHIQTEGWEALALRTIAARAGIAQGTIYNYFSSREEIAFTVVGESFSAMLSRVSDLPQADETTERAMRRLFGEFHAFMSVYRKIWEEGGFAAVAQGRHFHYKSMASSEGEILAILKRTLSRRKVAEGLDGEFVMDLIGHAFLRIARSFQGSCDALFPIIDRLLEAETIAIKEKGK
jgi:AcrR family transcriptional regulator